MNHKKNKCRRKKKKKKTHAPCVYASGEKLEEGGDGVTPLKECTQLHLPQARYPSARIEKTWRSFIGNHSGLPSGANDE